MYWIAHGIGGDKYNGGGEHYLCFNYYHDRLMLSLQIVVAQDSLIYLALQFLISYGTSGSSFNGFIVLPH
jgi:hypothetical protein